MVGRFKLEISLWLVRQEELIARLLTVAVLVVVVVVRKRIGIVREGMTVHTSMKRKRRNQVVHILHATNHHLAVNLHPPHK